MTAYTDFHYSPTGSGVISGSQVLEQTEQGINGLGQYVQDNISGAIDTANQALTIAQTANTNATTALNTANSFSDAITTANQTANNALTTAQSAQSTANSASSLATTANNNANTALNAANTATSNVATLTSSVNALGNRMTTAENAISANAGNITTLQNNLATTNANVTAAANAASSAQATATSAQATATSAKNAAYVLRYTGTTITGGGTIAYADIDNTDNIKAGDKIIDISGAIYAIASVDTTNQTVIVGASPVINLFCDAENLIPAANNSYDLGSSSYQWNNIYSKGYYYNGVAWGLDKVNTWTAQQKIVGNNSRGTVSIYNPAYTKGSALSSTDLSIGSIYMGDDGQQGLANSLSFISTDLASNGARTLLSLSAMENTASSTNRANLTIQYDKNDAVNPRKVVIQGSVIPHADATYSLGVSSYRWKTLNGVNPGALSLPTLNYTDTSKYVDISGGLSTTGSGDWYVPAVDGWVFIIVNNSPTFVNLLVFVTPDGVAPAKFIAGSGGVLESSSNAMWCSCPAPAGSRVRIRIKDGTIEQAVFVTCQGNV